MNSKRENAHSSIDLAEEKMLAFKERSEQDRARLLEAEAEIIRREKAIVQLALRLAEYGDPVR